MTQSLPSKTAGRSPGPGAALAVATVVGAVVLVIFCVRCVPVPSGKNAAAVVNSSSPRSQTGGIAMWPATLPADSAHVAPPQLAENTALDGPPAEADLDINNHTALAAYIARQPRDARWSARTEEALRSAYAAIPDPADAANRLEIYCATTLCQVSVTVAHDDEATTRLIDDVTAINARLSEQGQMFIAASTTAVSDDPEDAGRLRIIAFLQRDARMVTP